MEEPPPHSTPGSRPLTPSENLGWQGQPGATVHSDPAQIHRSGVRKCGMKALSA